MCLASAQRRRVVRDNTGSHCADECELSQAKRPRIQESGDAYEIHHDMKSTRTVTNPATGKLSKRNSTLKMQQSEWTIDDLSGCKITCKK